jgi:hypothetical protein
MLHVLRMLRVLRMLHVRGMLHVLYLLGMLDLSISTLFFCICRAKSPPTVAIIYVDTTALHSAW